MFQARALTPQQAETEKIRFLIGTQSLKQSNNQIHLVEFDDENSTIKTNVFYFTYGEIWKLTSSPHDSSLVGICYNTITDDNSCLMKSAILKLPKDDISDQIENLDILVDFDTANFGSEVKTIEFHPSDETKSVCITDSQIVLWDITGSSLKCALNVVLEGKNNPKFTIGKWNPHQNCNQVLILNDILNFSFKIFFCYSLQRLLRPI